MSDRLDRVAQAIAGNRECEIECIDPLICSCRSDARAAIEALREPTEEMRAALEKIVEQADRKFAVWRPLFGPDCTKPDAVQIDWVLIEKARAVSNS